jgi:hypothetical protein
MTKLLWRAVTAAIKPVTIMLRLNNVPQYGAWLFNPEVVDGFENYPCT